MLPQEKIVELCRQSVDNLNVRTTCREIALWTKSGAHDKAADIMREVIYKSCASCLRSVLAEYEKEKAK